MPQIIKSIKHLDTDPGAILRRPTLAAMIAAVASNWTRVENDLAELFVGLLGEDEDAALAIYLELIDQSVRKAAFDALARTKLKPESLQQFEALFNKVRKKAKQRNRMVHGFWAVSNEHPDGLILLDARDFYKEDYAYKKTKFTNLQDTADWLQKSINRIEKTKYIEDDFAEIISRISALRGDIAQFRAEAKFLPKS